MAKRFIGRMRSPGHVTDEKDVDSTFEVTLSSEDHHSVALPYACCVPIIIDNAGMQELGSVISYARRYRVTLITCTVADEDDDANMAEGNAVAKAPLSAPINPRDGFFDSLPKEDKQRILDMAIEVKDAWGAGDLDTAFRAHVKHNKSLEAEQKIALWDQYDTKLRSALTKRLEEVKAARAKAELGGQA